MKLFLIFLLFCSCFSESQWIEENHRGVRVDPKGTVAYYLSPYAEKVKFKVECERMCDIHFMTYPNYMKFMNGERYQWNYYEMNSLGISYEFFDRNFIKDTMTVVVVNSGLTQWRANFYLYNFMQPLFNWALFTGISVPSSLFVCCILSLFVFAGACVFAVWKLRRSKYVLVNDEEDPVLSPKNDHQVHVEEVEDHEKINQGNEIKD